MTIVVGPGIDIGPGITIGGAAGGGGGSIITDNLIMQLDASNPASYSGIGATWFDISGNSNDGTINGATYLADNGGIFDFNGTSNQVQIADNANLRLSTTQQRTIQVWVKFDALPAVNTQRPVFGKLSSSFAFDGYWGGLFSNTGSVRVVTNGTAVQRVTTTATPFLVTTDTWYLFTFISQITGTANTTKIYMNNQEWASTAHGADGYSESNPLYLGWIGSGVSSLYLDGKIGAAYFYTTGLSAADVTANFDATKSRYGL
jgi:hypothetical protein